MELKVIIRDTQDRHELTLKNVDSFSYQGLSLRVYFLDMNATVGLKEPGKVLETFTFSPVYSFKSVPD